MWKGGVAAGHFHRWGVLLFMTDKHVWQLIFFTQAWPCLDFQLERPSQFVYDSYAGFEFAVWQLVFSHALLCPALRDECSLLQMCSSSFHSFWQLIFSHAWHCFEFSVEKIHTGAGQAISLLSGADPGAGAKGPPPCRKVPPTLEAIHTTFYMFISCEPAHRIKNPQFWVSATPHEESWSAPDFWQCMCMFIVSLTRSLWEFNLLGLSWFQKLNVFATNESCLSYELLNWFNFDFHLSMRFRNFAISWQHALTTCGLSKKWWAWTTTYSGIHQLLFSGSTWVRVGKC